MTASQGETPNDQVDVVLPSTTGSERTLEGLATVTSLAPELGGVISNIFSGAASKRRQERVRAALAYVLALVADVSNEQSNYVRSDDFEDLLIETMRRVESERSEEKRRAYGRLLAYAVESAGEAGYDELFRFVRVLEDLQPDHIRVMWAIVAQPDPPEQPVMAGSRRATLEARLPDIPRERLRELTEQLGDIRLIDASGLGAMVTGPSAIDLGSLSRHLAVGSSASYRRSDWRPLQSAPRPNTSTERDPPRIHVDRQTGRWHRCEPRVHGDDGAIRAKATA